MSPGTEGPADDRCSSGRGPRVATARRPYEQAQDAWGVAGWRGVLPLPPGQKKRPPEGFTGLVGRDPTAEELARWRRTQPNGNAALRLPLGVVGLDVDDYDGKHGGRTFAEHERHFGSLPPTWTITSRSDGVSGTRLYRALIDGDVRSELEGGDVDIICWKLRYTVIPPSLHPEGREYQLFGPGGSATDRVPTLGDLPDLPAAWLPALLKPKLRKATPAHKARQPTSVVRVYDHTAIDLAQDSIRSGASKTMRDEAGLKLEDLAQALGLSTQRARHLELGELRRPGRGLLERYGAWLLELDHASDNGHRMG